MAKSNSTKDFYVYVHRKATTGQVFYVGKGHGKRAFSSLSRNRQWKFIVAKHGYTVEIVQDKLQEWYAFELEIDLIAYYGRETLSNFSDGGEGPAGCVHSEEANALKSAIVKKTWDSSESRKARMSALHKDSWANPDARAKRIEAMKQSHSSPEARENKKEYMRKANAKPIICIETGVTYRTLADAVDWLSATRNKKHFQQCLGQAASGKMKTAYGYTWRYA